ncbi:hypothetical protein [Xanthomonas campestris]|uniref:hypothetical protein n=1 Tax=Xanthomonas campestris TaxID=339 RepID=UPI00388F9A1B
MFPGLKKKAPPAAAEAKEVAQPVEQEQSAVIDRGIPKLNAGARGMPAAIKVVLIVSVIFALVGVAGTVALSKWKADRQMAEEEEAAPKGDTESKLPQLAATDFAETPLPPDAVAAQAQLDNPEAPPPAELPPRPARKVLVPPVTGDRLVVRRAAMRCRRSLQNSSRRLSSNAGKRRRSLPSTIRLPGMAVASSPWLPPWVALRRRTGLQASRRIC